MRVFILCTGRNGSTTIIKACKHITNYTSGHETQTKSIGNKRFDYPENHIEADNRLSWHLGQLNQLFGDEPFYVHLKRDKDQVAQSFFKRYDQSGSIIDAFCDGIRMNPKEKLSNEARLQVCYDYIETVNTNIEHFLSDKSKVMTINLETIDTDFLEFWKQINAVGNSNLAIETLNNQHNSSSRRKFNYRLRLKLLAIREWRHLKMCLSIK